MKNVLSTIKKNDANLIILMTLCPVIAKRSQVKFSGNKKQLWLGEGMEFNGLENGEFLAKLSDTVLSIFQAFSLRHRAEEKFSMGLPARNRF